MRSRRWLAEYAGFLLLLAAIFYALRWYRFISPTFHNEMLRFLLGDVAFLFVQVLLVSLVLDGITRRREREEMLTKLNMVIGAFFSETGTELLGLIARSDARLGDVRDDLLPTLKWTTEDYDRSRATFAAHKPQVDLTTCDLERLRDTLQSQRGFLIGLLGNQNLFEHETFSDLLWALTHVGEELAARADLSELPPADAIHLAGDVKRAYLLLGAEWIAYLRHLQTNYPYLFSLATRTNPLDPEANVTVTA